MSTARRYPSRPLVGAGAVVHRGDKVLLVRRRFPPNVGRWAIPGGLVELGEKTEDAAVRETFEETGYRVKLEGLLDVQTSLQFDGASRIEYHYVLVDYLARPVGGKLLLNPESSEAGWFDQAQTTPLEMWEGTRKVLRIFSSQRHR